MALRNRKNCLFFRLAHAVILACFFSGQILPYPYAAAQTASILNLPTPGTMVAMSPKYVPLIVKGIKVFPENPFRFDFILDTGHTQFNSQELNDESRLLIKYFLTALTIPDQDQWVNLSPFEKDRIVPNEFGVTEMGRDLLAQDYLLKQLTATLIYPENELGKQFWQTIYKKAYEKFGSTDIPVNTFNKVWIMPDHAKVYEYANTAVIKESRLRVLLEEDYLAMSKGAPEFQKPSDPAGTLTTGTLGPRGTGDPNEVNSLGSAIVREIVLPEIEREVNEGKNFAKLRQIYHSMIMAAWYKRKLKDSILGKLYVGANKVAGVDVADKAIKQKIYEQYLEAYKRGVYNYIKEDVDQYTREVIPRKYFSGGVIAEAVDQTTSVELPGPGVVGATAQETTGSLGTVSWKAAPVDGSGAVVAGADVLSQRAQQDDALASTHEFLIFTNGLRYAPYDPVNPGARKDLLEGIADGMIHYEMTNLLRSRVTISEARLDGLRAILENVFMNAIDAILQKLDAIKEPVELENAISAAKIVLTFKEGSDGFEIGLSDTGIGISKAILEGWKVGYFYSTKNEGEFLPETRRYWGGSGASMRRLVGLVKEHNFRVRIVSKQADDIAHSFTMSEQGQVEVADIIDSRNEVGTGFIISGRLSVNTGGALWDMGVRDVAPDPIAEADRNKWEEMSLAQDFETFLSPGIAGERAKVIVSEMPAGRNAFRFRNMNNELVIVLSPQLAGSMREEAIYHEVREDYWETRLRNEWPNVNPEIPIIDESEIERQSHVLASAEQSIEYGFKRNKLTDFHIEQIRDRNKTVEYLQKILDEDRSRQHELVGIYFSLDQVEEYLAYEGMVRKEIQQELAKRQAEIKTVAGNQVNLEIPVFDGIAMDALNDLQARPEQIEKIRQAVVAKVMEAFRSTGETEGALGYEIGRLAGAAIDSIVSQLNRFSYAPEMREDYIRNAKISLNYVFNPEWGTYTLTLSDNGGGISRGLLSNLEGVSQSSLQGNPEGYRAYIVLNNMTSGAMRYNRWEKIAVVSKERDSRNAYRFFKTTAGQPSVNDFDSPMESGTEITITGRSLNKVASQGSAQDNPDANTPDGELKKSDQSMLTAENVAALLKKAQPPRADDPRWNEFASLKSISQGSITSVMPLMLLEMYLKKQPLDLSKISEQVPRIKNISQELKVLIDFLDRLLSDTEVSTVIQEIRANPFIVNDSSTIPWELNRLLQTEVEAEFNDLRSNSRDLLEAIRDHYQGILKDVADLQGQLEQMTVQGSESTNLGGIDLNANALNLQTEGTSVPLNLPVDLSQWQNIKFEGFTPVILEINTTNIPLFLGATSETEKPIQLSSV